MNILITGASGYIGGFVVSKLKNLHDLHLVGKNPDLLSAYGKPVIQDLSLPLAINKFPTKVDAIIHLAQSRNYRDLKTGAEDMFNINVKSTFDLIRYAVEIGAKQFCYISTGSVYTPAESLLKENTELSPVSMYGASKLAGEQILRPYSNQIEISVLRLFMVYGPGQTNKMLPDLIHKVENNLPISIAGEEDGSLFATTYVEDVVSVIEQAINNKWSGTYNVASNSTVSVKKMGELIGRSLNKKPILQYDSANKPMYFVPDLSRLAGCFNLDRMVDFESGLNKIFSAK